MTIRKVLVEFTLDPTEYVSDGPDSDEGPYKDTNSKPLFATRRFKDTQRAAVKVVKAMLAHEADISEYKIIGDTGVRPATDKSESPPTIIK
jgi:hypothetical protein